MSEEQTTTPIPENVLRQAKKAEELLTGKNETPPDNDLQKKLDAIQHKYNVLQGKYNAEVPRLNQGLSEAQSLIESQKAEIENLQQQPVKTEIPTLDIEKFKENEFEDEIIELVNTVNQLAANQKNNDPQSLKAEIKKHEEYIQAIANSETEKAENLFFDGLKKNVADWEIINDDPEFISWLSEIDETSGLTRHEILTIARERLNVQAASNIFKTFKNNGKRKVRSLASEIVPDSTFGSEIPAPQKGNITQADVARAASEFARGRLSEKEFNKIANEFQKTL